jgi:hypothetical protein
MAKDLKMKIYKKRMNTSISYVVDTGTHKSTS